jgi:hypothetical protein
MNTINNKNQNESMTNNNKTETNNNIIEHKCKICNKKFSTKYTLINHNLKTCVKDAIDLKCKKCNKIFSTKQLLQNHNLKNCLTNSENTTVSAHKCNICNKNFSTKYTLLNHTLKKCNNIYIQIDGKYRCNICEKIYTSKLNLKYHMLKTCNKYIESNELKIKNKELENKVIELEKIIEEYHINMDNKIDKPNITTFGTEDINKLSIKERGHICSSGPAYLVECLKLLHFNDNIPEYQNIRITNLRGITGRMYINSRWIDHKMDTVLNNVINNINKKCKEMFDLPFPDNIRQNRINFTKDYVTGKEMLSDPMARREDVKICIYNESKLLQ